MLTGILFLIFNSLSRVSLIAFALFDKQIDFSFIDILQVLSFGFFNDIITVCYFLAPLALIRLIFSSKNSTNKVIRAVIDIYNFILISALCFLIVAEFTFWLEFSTRFNFIAVDYLVYTHEVIGNIRESYPIFIIFPLLLMINIIIYASIRNKINATLDHSVNLRTKIQQFICFTLVAIFSFFYYEPKITDIRDNNYLSELSKNGLYNLFSAFLHNSIDYYALYQSKDTQEAITELSQYISQNQHTPFTRHIEAVGKQQDYNIMLITVESLSAEFFTILYEDKPITPVLNELIKHSIYFDNFYATGTRTVRGLEAITLSIPPLPGQSILRREQNKNLFSIASVLNRENYDIKFIYGGYGYFDNMNHFFSHNGFKIIDRNNVPKEEIEFANIWGISDEDLYKQAIKQADLSYTNNQKFFSLIMTTSNHRPYTYPNGKIDIPSPANRQGGVKYSDYAIGEFLKQAATKPWFNNTIFVITADHCSGSAGRTALPPHKYHIPLLFYAPNILKPQVIHKLASQIDLAPTILGLLNITYESKFFGNDIFTKTYENAFISTFQKLGYIENNKLTILAPAKIVQTYKLLDNNQMTEIENDVELNNRAIDYYQSAYYLYQNGLLKANDHK